MSPRKRAKPNPSIKEHSDVSLPATLRSQASGSVASQASAAPGRSMQSMKGDGSDASTSTKSNDIKQVRKSRSWYGSWPRVPKSSASTQVSHQNIMGGTLRPRASPDFSRFESKKDNDNSESDSQSIKTLPKISETGTESKQDDTKSMKPQETSNAGASDANNGNDVPKDLVKDQEGLNTTTNNSTIEPPIETLQQPPNSSGWLGGWFGRPSAPGVAIPNDDKMDIDPPKEPESVEPENVQINIAQQPSEPSQVSIEPIQPLKPTSSWFGYWYSTTPTIPEDSAQTTAETSSAQKSALETPDVVMEDAPPSKPTEPSQPPTSSTWAFWSRDTSQKNDTKKTTANEAGELAIIGDGSEANPRQSTSPEVNGNSTSAKEPSIKGSKALKEAPLRVESIKRNKRGRPQSLDIDEPLSRPGTPQSDISTKTAPAKPATPGSSKSSTQNLLLPSFRNTYHMKNNPSIIRQITQLLLRTQQPPTNHVFLVKEPPKIKKAVAIGIHGLFPASYLRPMIGQPTGTSIRFANHCAEAIRRWTGSHGCDECEIEKIALEGEGKIAERVDNLWKLLLNWIEHIRAADLIVLACHSQGVPVGLMLLEKLIDLGIITKSKIGICAMAGVSLGPFPDYKSGMGMLMGSAAELWQFADPESEISKRYQHALEVVVAYGARLTYIGSIDDQLVPMESAIYTPASHPYIYRAVFIDGRVHAPDFIAHLVGFALKLRNLGISDHGLIRELSIPLAGSLYSGEGHSRLYDDEQVYDLAISHALETTNVSGVPCRIQKPEKLVNPNPFLLPWIMRGLLEEEFVKTELYSETTELLKQFDDWSPTNKALKDVKYRLEAVRSKL
ncbi:uncharacterized protein GGS22DRAFT_166949 [Annulohypoxylon maeteangense]|uniref:uncharacterized protein n=1 Tax=Annulohypoxylon maeteangense TaxID=1927788 RepID=UPI0020086179|nr:uncharacterized protein GGS22DRAFT_166949 [Annulohypoxylon maeteangense]KAI0883424.1 hypothetical protein GGS22DRAFT_166949 [Annulohypoxylon maeteangense]